jgi:tetrahydromethanopterin S-methyltransferase subunit G
MESNEQLKEIDRKIEAIMCNHLPHIYEALGELPLLRNITIGVLVGVILLLVGLAVEVILR